MSEVRIVIPDHFTPDTGFSEFFGRVVVDKTTSKPCSRVTLATLNADDSKEIIDIYNNGNAIELECPKCGARVIIPRSSISESE